MKIVTNHWKKKNEINKCCRDESLEHHLYFTYIRYT